MTHAERAMEHVDAAVSILPVSGINAQIQATLAATHATLALVDELAKFQAVAVEERKP